MSAINWTNLYKKYRGMWVALRKDEKTVLGSGKTAPEAFVNARKKSKEMPYLMRMPETLEAFTGGLS